MRRLLRRVVGWGVGGYGGMGSWRGSRVQRYRAWIRVKVGDSVRTG